ncbi:MAG TPA: PD-(D/E)XK nuclease family protein [Bacteroidaceae bacterium]|nr:PD-(D/E)XK nuclease family protein [Bacteroidaceae bacterium]
MEKKTNTSSPLYPPFLQMVAEDLYQKFGDNLNDVAVVFPNKRARLFFNEYLSHQQETPIWSPSFVNISELLEKGAKWQIADPILLICTLHKIFTQITGSKESLDDFYFWGEILIADFDDVDKQMVDADKLFQNLEDLQELTGDTSWLEPHQREALAQFFQHISLEDESEIQRQFTQLWKKLGNIYHAFKEELAQMGLSYSGMLYREIVENLDPSTLPYKQYCFVGFNVLNEVERQLFKKLDNAGKAIFYWDFDRFYVDNTKHEAGEFIRQNLRLFPNAIDVQQLDVLKNKKRIEIISTTTENAQARYLQEWSQEGLMGRERENAIVLCNEAILQPAMHALPEGIENVNITMGYPLQQTPIYSLIQDFTDVQLKGYRRKSGNYRYAHVLPLLRHPYVQMLSEEAYSLIKCINDEHIFYPTPLLLQGSKDNQLLKLLFEPLSSSMELCTRLCQIMQTLTVLYQTTEEKKDLFTANKNSPSYPPIGDLFADQFEANTPTDKEKIEFSHESPRKKLFDELYRESIFQCYTRINRLKDLLLEQSLEIKTSTLSILIGRILSATQIPFHGEPAIGLQILGVLETRNLDFRNLLILSLNEGKLPKSDVSSSFIPYNLRKAFGMTTMEHKNAVFAYYFYRLIQRAEKITMIYNTSSDGLNRGEASRYIQQLLTDWNHPVKRSVLAPPQKMVNTRKIMVEKTPLIMDRLFKRYNLQRADQYNSLQERFIQTVRQMELPYDKRTEKNLPTILSPSALNVYIDCSLKFYMRYIANIKELDETTEEIDNALFGSIVHRSAELAYDYLTAQNNLVTVEEIEQLMKQPLKLRGFVSKAFRELYFKSEDKTPEYNGIQLITENAIYKYLRKLLNYDKRRAPFKYVASERYIARSIRLNKDLVVMTGGYIDRMDQTENKAGGDTLHMIDYKSGGQGKKPTTMQQITQQQNNRAYHIFQTFVYAGAMSHYAKGMQSEETGFSYLAGYPQFASSIKIAPELLYLKMAGAEDYSAAITYGGKATGGKIIVDDYSEQLEQEFEEALQGILSELFNPEIPFIQTDAGSDDVCKYCEYAAICGKTNR